MKVTKDVRAAHREALLEAASRLVRERGPDGVGVAEVSAAAGLTHGGFYRQFASKDALVAEAVERSFAETTRAAAAACAEGGLERFAESYLSPAHVADRAGGCVIAALGGDMPRQGDEVRGAYAQGLRAYLEALAGTSEDRDEAIRRLAMMVGALYIARGVAGIDDALADQVLEAVRPV